MLIQFSLNSAEARRMLAAGFWRWQVVQGARRLIMCRSTTGAALMTYRWSDFPWESFAAGVTATDGVTVQRLPGSEAIIEGGAWRSGSLTEVPELSAADCIVKSANAYDGTNAGVLLGHREGFGTMGRIFPGLGAGEGATGCPAKVIAPMLSEKLVPVGFLEESGYPDKTLGWPSRFMVYRPDYIFDERDAMAHFGASHVRIVGRGASHDGFSVTTYHVEADAAAMPGLLAAVNAAKGATLLPFAVAGALEGGRSSSSPSWRDTK